MVPGGFFWGGADNPVRIQVSTVETGGADLQERFDKGLKTVSRTFLSDSK